jgi:hypothetical protein
MSNFTPPKGDLAENETKWSKIQDAVVTSGLPIFTSQKLV